VIGGSAIALLPTGRACWAGLDPHNAFADNVFGAPHCFAGTAEGPTGASPDTGWVSQVTSWSTTDLVFHRCPYVAARPRRPAGPRFVRADV